MNPFVSKLLTATLVEDKVLLNYRMGMADGVTLFSCRQGEQEYTLIAEDDPGPVMDTRAKLDPGHPERRRYVAVFLYNSNEDCRRSNEIEIILP